MNLASETIPESALSVAEGFQIERIYSVPIDKLDSWVSMTSDDFGRLITSDQKGKFYRVSPPALSGSETIVEPIDLDIGRAHDQLCAFGNCYPMVNGQGADSLWSS